MSEQLITYELDGNVAKIGLNRPAKRNALSFALMQQLEAAVNRAGEEARVGLIFSHNEHFCGGMDLAEARSWITDQSKYLEMRVGSAAKGRPHDYLARGRIPFVVAISGACVGGGLELATSCHIRVGDETSYFALPEGQRGFYIGGGGSVRIGRLLGVARMTDMMLTGRVLSAEEGERYNLLQYCVPKGEHIQRATSLAHRVAENAPLVNWAVISGLPRIQDCSYDDGLFMEGVFSQITMTAESAERVEEFVSGRARPLVQPGKSGDEHNDKAPAGDRGRAGHGAA